LETACKRPPMISADLCSANLDANTCRVDLHTLRPMKTTPSKETKRHVADELGLAKPKAKHALADLDTLVNSMETSDVLPSSGKGVRARGVSARGVSARGSVRRPVEELKPSKRDDLGGRYSERDRIYDRIAAKYDLPVESPEETGAAKAKPRRKGIRL
jgi:hypothetical protein